jgi:DNA replication licensing factor MCM6
LIAWYLNEIESTIENEDQLNEQNVLIEKILHRLINYDNVIIQLDKMGLKTAEEPTEQMQHDEADPILVVHPNYIPSE